MAKTTVKKKTSRSRRKKSTAPAAILAKIRVEVRGWYRGALNMDNTGEYAKMLRAVEFFFTQAEKELDTVLWDRATQVSIQEAMLHLFLLWGPEFKSDLHFEIRITDTQAKFSITVPREALAKKKGAGSRKQGGAAEDAADKSLYVIKRLMDRLQTSPNKRQLVFRRLVKPRRLPTLGRRPGWM